MLVLSRPDTRKIPVNRGVPFQIWVNSFFGALLSRFDCRKDQRGHKQPEQDRRYYQRERENHRGHSAHDPTEANGNPRCIRVQAQRGMENRQPRPGVCRSLVLSSTTTTMTGRAALPTA